jgi:DNA repair protein RecN (Recombination protein N)
MRDEIRELEERQELHRFQLREIESADLKEGEDGHLEEERRRLRYAEELMALVNDAYERLYELEDSVLSNLSYCKRAVEKGEEMDERLQGVKRSLESAQVELEEAAFSLREMGQGIVIDPRRLEEVEERLQRIRGLKKRYGASIREILHYKEEISGSVEELEQKREALKETGSELKEAEKTLLARASDLSRKRRKVAEGLEQSVREEMALLAMEGTRFRVGFNADKEPTMDSVGPDGCDRIEFLIAPNTGESLRPLAKIASGGELSRIMLALKTILARQGSVETIVFDEIDAGIGGATAEVIGDKLQALAEYHQILCITHLPQIASKGKSHFLVEKGVRAKRTVTSISELDFEQRVQEIARLLGGKEVSRKAVSHAREMLG